MFSKYHKSLRRFLTFLDSDIQSKPNECWIWRGAKIKSGYGIFRISHANKFAHRISYSLFKGPINKHIDVLHKCDNPSCVNPAHLFLGTQKINNDDCISKGRAFKCHGDEHPYAVLTENQIPEIFKLKQQGVVQNRIAEMFNVAPMTISDVLRRKTWKHVK